MLIEKGADGSIANADGNTALHIASFFTQAEFVRVLLETATTRHCPRSEQLATCCLFVAAVSVHDAMLVVLCRIMSTIREIRWFLCDRFPIRCEVVKITRTELRERETFSQLRERVPPRRIYDVGPVHIPGTGRRSDTVNRMTKCEFVVVVTLLTLLTAILLFLSKLTGRETVSVCIVFCRRPVEALIGTLKGRKLKNGRVGIQGTRDRVWPVRCMIGDFMFPLGRQSAAAGRLCFLGENPRNLRPPLGLVPVKPCSPLACHGGSVTSSGVTKPAQHPRMTRQ